MSPSARRPTSLTDQLVEFCRARPGQWVNGLELTFAGSYAWAAASRRSVRWVRPGLSSTGRTLKVLNVSRTNRSISVWRYMSFGRFVWMLKKKALWMCRVDRLGDAWEMTFSNEELETLLVDPEPARLGHETPELVALKDKVRAAREQTYVCCWRESDDESHAMWSIYSGSNEGIAVQTTLRKLKESVNEPVIKVTYEEFSRNRLDDLNIADLVSRKRKFFRNEQEHRIVSTLAPWQRTGARAVLGERLGFRLAWDPEEHVEHVLIHPGADDAMFQAVKAVVEAMAPKLLPHVVKSAMAGRPAL